ncbi:hypothetical protein Ahia01_000837300 [Argonauta hians]
MNNHRHKVRNQNSYEKSVTFEDIKKLMKILNQKLNVAIKEEVTFSTGDHTNTMVEDTMETPLHGQYKNVKKSKMSADAPEFIPRSQQLIQLKSIFSHFPFENNDDEGLMIQSNAVRNEGAAQLNEAGKSSKKISISFPPPSDQEDDDDDDDDDEDDDDEDDDDEEEEEEKRRREKDISQMTRSNKAGAEEDGKMDETSDAEDNTSSNEEITKVLPEKIQPNLKQINRNFSAIDKGNYNENEEYTGFGECVEDILGQNKSYMEDEIDENHVVGNKAACINDEDIHEFLNGENERSGGSVNDSNSTDDCNIGETTDEDLPKLHNETPASDTAVTKDEDSVSDKESEMKDKNEAQNTSQDNETTAQGGDIGSRLRAEMLAFLNKGKNTNENEEENEDKKKIEDIKPNNNDNDDNNNNKQNEEKTSPEAKPIKQVVSEDLKKDGCNDNNPSLYINGKENTSSIIDECLESVKENIDKNMLTNSTNNKTSGVDAKEKNFNDVNEISSNTDTVSTIDEVNGTDHTEQSSVELSNETFNNKSPNSETYNMGSPVLICHKPVPKYIPMQGGNLPTIHYAGKEDSSNNNKKFEAFQLNQRMFRKEDYVSDKADHLNEYLSKMKEMKVTQEEFKKKWNANLSKRELAYYTYLKCTEKANIYRTWADNVPTILPTKLWNTKKQNSFKWQSISDDISLLCLKSEVVLSKMKAEKHKDKYEEIDRTMLNCIQEENNNKAEQNELEIAWKNATSTEERMAREMWSYRRKWLENYAKFYQKPEIIDKMSSVSGKRMR